jgi:hypothetical protein
MAVTNPGGMPLGLSTSVRAGADHTNAIRAIGASLLAPIRKWCSTRTDRVSECYAIFSPTEVLLFVIGKEDPYDFTLGGELAEFTADLLAADWPVQATLLPSATPEELTAFFDAGEAVLLFRA